MKPQIKWEGSEDENFRPESCTFLGEFTPRTIESSRHIGSFSASTYVVCPYTFTKDWLATTNAKTVHFANFIALPETLLITSVNYIKGQGDWSPEKLTVLWYGLRALREDGVVGFVGWNRIWIPSAKRWCRVTAADKKRWQFDGKMLGPDNQPISTPENGIYRVLDFAPLFEGG